MKIISSENNEKWLKETYDYLQKLKDDKYGDVKLDYIMLYEIHKEEHKELKRLNKDLQTAIDICNKRQEEIVRLKSKIEKAIEYINKIKIKSYPCGGGNYQEDYYIDNIEYDIEYIFYNIKKIFLGSDSND